MNVLDRGEIIYLPHDTYGYFAWPTVSYIPEMDRIVTVCSGFRQQHQGDYGRLVSFATDPKTMQSSGPLVVQDTPNMDDRDGGIFVYENAVIISSFISDPKNKEQKTKGYFITRNPTESVVSYHPISNSHGVYMDADDVWMLGKHNENGQVQLFKNVFKNGLVSILPLNNLDTWDHWFEPHMTVHKGRFYAGVRWEYDENGNIYTYLLDSDDGIKWTIADHKLNGAPPYLLSLDEGLLVTYGYRRKPYGALARLYTDRLNPDKAFDFDIDLRMSDSDCGYPSTVRLPDKTLVTVTYGRKRKRHKCGLFYTRWEL